LLNDRWEIICGNSDKMIQIVRDKLDWLYEKHGVEWYKPTHNTFGSIWSGKENFSEELYIWNMM